MNKGRIARRGSASRFVVTMTACVCLLLVFAVFAIRHVLVDLPGEVVRRAGDQTRATAMGIAEDVAGIFQARPKVTVGTRTVVEQDTAVARMIVLERDVVERRLIEDSWLHSTKAFEVEGRFKVTAGFDLVEKFEIHLDETGSRIDVRLPPAKILGADLVDLKILRDEDGFWNKLTAKDREEAINAVRLHVMRKAAADRLDDKARAIAEEKLRRMLSRDGATVDFEKPTLP